MKAYEPTGIYASFNECWDYVTRLGIGHLLVVEAEAASDSRSIECDLHDWAGGNKVLPPHTWHRGDQASPCRPSINRVRRSAQSCPWCPNARRLARDGAVVPGVPIQYPAVAIGFFPADETHQPIRDCLARAQAAGLTVRVVEAQQ